MTTGSLPRRSVVVHAHFYQPPREDPWLEILEREPSAAPYHDWNERIERECYRAVAAARLPAPDGRIARIANTLESISFNVGATLADWLEREAPTTWAAMLSADRESRLRLGGHGNAIAMPYHHIILPLASRRDKTTEVRWGLADFRRRFGREAEGMWLPETAVDEETLDVLAAEGVRFTVLAPHQVVEAPAAGLAGKYTTTSGRVIALFIYDGPLSHDVAFGPLINDAARWSAEMLDRELPETGPLLVSLATDGETFGHHHAFGEMALAATLDRVRRAPGTRIENFASFLARHPATHDVELLAPSSWSCVHGVERWRSDCGCRVRPETSQAWRAPLREGLDQLAGGLHALFEDEAGTLLPDPWAARDAYSTTGMPSHLPVRARELLEMERDVLRMFSSCGWFFDDIAGLEPIICLRFAARAIGLAGPRAAPLEAALRERLALAESNDPAEGTGRDVYDRSVVPRHPADERAAAAYAALALAAPQELRPVVGSYLVEHPEDGVLRLQHRRTGKTTRLRTAAEREGRTEVVVRVQREDQDEGRRFALDDQIEPARTAVRAALARELRQEVLTAEEQAQITDGLITFRRAIALALVRQLPADPHGAHGLDLERLATTLDLLALEDREIPFDAQTRFYHLITRGPRELRRPLRSLAGRMGFALPADESGGP